MTVTDHMLGWFFFQYKCVMNYIIDVVVVSIQCSEKVSIKLIKIHMVFFILNVILKLLLNVYYLCIDVILSFITLYLMSE